MSLDVFCFGDVLVDRAAVVAEIPLGIVTKNDLFHEYDMQLRFPEYFGANWDAFDECMSDLSWLPDGTIVVRHQDLPLSGDRHNLRCFVSILAYAVWKFRERGDQDLVVVMPTCERATVQSVLRDCFPHLHSDRGSS